MDATPLIEEQRVEPAPTRPGPDFWYVRRGHRVQGPYPDRELTRHLLLGRVLPSDRVSRDGTEWRSLSDVPSLIPEAMRDLHSEAGWKRYLEARREVDERDQDGVTPAATRDRRRQDDAEFQRRLRALWTQGEAAADSDAQSASPQRRVGRGDLLVAGLLALSALLLALLFLL